MRTHRSVRNTEKFDKEIIALSALFGITETAVLYIAIAQMYAREIQTPQEIAVMAAKMQAENALKEANVSRNEVVINPEILEKM